MKNLTLHILVFLCVGLTAQEAFTFRNYQVTINVDEDGTMHVTENMDVNFTEERHGIIHKIPYKYNVEDRPYSLTIKDIDVTGAPVQTSRGSHEITLRIGDGSKFVTGSQDYKVEYTVAGAIANYNSHDEFYWNVIGFDTDATINQASFSIRFPYEWRDSLYEYTSFSGRRGSTSSEIYLSKNGSQFTGAITEPLGPREGITLAVKIPKGLIKYSKGEQVVTVDSQEADKARNSYISWLFTIPMLIATGAFYLFQFLSRRGKKEPAPIQYYPPDDLTPAEVGTFFDHRVNRRDIISMLPYWGELGLVKMRPIDGEGGDLSFYRIQEIPDTHPKYEIDFFNSLFEDGDTILLSDLRNSFYKKMKQVSKGICEEVEDLNLYDTELISPSTKGRMLGSAVFFILIGIVFIIKLQVIVPSVLLILLGIGQLIFFFIKPKKLSILGKETHQHLSGLRAWLKDPEPQQLNELLEENPLYLSQIFPYVLAFGLDKSWEKRFDDLAVPPPIWYDYNHMETGHRNYNYSQFTKDFQPHKIEQVFYSTPAPTPSSGGSSGGGGFSGGSAGGGFGGSSTSSW